MEFLNKLLPNINEDTKYPPYIDETKNNKIYFLIKLNQQVKLAKFKPLLKDLINDHDYEFSINYYSEKYIEIIKGTKHSSYTPFGVNIDIHTHPKSLKLDGRKYSPPSAYDYREYLLDTNNWNKKKFIVTTEGLYTIKVNNKLQERFKKDIKSFPFTINKSITNKEGGIFSKIEGPKFTKEDNDQLNKLLEVIINRSNDIGLKYSQTKFAPNEFGKIIEVKGFETININKYIEEINNNVLIEDSGIGFEVELLSWDEDWIFNIPLNERDSEIKRLILERNQLLNIDEYNKINLFEKINSTDEFYIIKFN